MKFTQFEHQILPHILAPLLGGLFVICALHNAARAEPTPSSLGAGNFIVSAADGYGVNDCIKSGDDCAKIVADAWCSAHGHANAISYGRASDITGAIKVSAKSDAPHGYSADDVYISCGE